MADTKHTPGPWYRSGCRRKIADMDNHSIVATVDGKEIVIASVWYDPVTHEGFHDANLMAASPRLVSALIGAVNGWERWYSQLPVAAEETEFTEIFEARRAIAQALGLDDWRHAFPQHDPRSAIAQAEGA